MDQLLEKISYSTTKASMQFSIRYLIRRGLIEKKPQEIRRGRRRVVYGLTMNALKSFDPGTDQWDIVVEGFNDEDLDPDLEL